jgi:hypothetical protein
MHVFRLLALPGVMGLSVALAGAGDVPAAQDDLQPEVRTVYVTVTDRRGAPVPDLAAADFTIKEGGREREVLKAEPATARMRLALMAEERLLGEGSIRIGLFEIMKRLQPVAETAFITIGLRNHTVVDYTTDLSTLVTALNALSRNPAPHSNLTEGILDIGKALERDRPARPVVVVVAVSGGQSGGASANEVLNQLRQSGATMHVVSISSGLSATDPIGSLADQSNREQVLGDGAKQSGGRRIEVTATIGVPKGLQQIASDLSSQYVVQYALPAGVKPDRRLDVSLKRRGLSLRAPSLIPDR